jgi:hypothetical protein
VSHKPVITKGVASHYAARDESIYDVGDSKSGALISVRRTDEGLVIEVYRADDDVVVRTPKEERK